MRALAGQLNTVSVSTVADLQLSSSSSSAAAAAAAASSSPSRRGPVQRGLRSDLKEKQKEESDKCARDILYIRERERERERERRRVLAGTRGSVPTDGKTISTDDKKYLEQRLQLS